MSAKKTKDIKFGAVSGQLSPVAIVGMAGIFPEAQNLERYWENILDEVNCIREVPASRWSVEDYYDPDPSAPDKTYSRHGGFIPDIQFDPMEFGLPPNFLEVTDVSQLLGLIVARDALADAGYPEKNKEVLNRTGVILGMVGMSSKVIQPLLNRLQYPVWEKVLRSSSVPDEEIPEIIEKMKLAYIGWNENAFPGAIGNVVAGRIANRLDLGGTNCIVDAACGSSLAAVSMAVNELALGQSDMMITGGVDTDNSILTFLCFSKTPAFSKGDHLCAFSAESDGMLAGEGIGMLVLKRLEDAERDGDRIYAVIRGVGTSSDGNFKSIYAPRPSGQAKALRRAYQSAGYAPDTVALIEAHGTGTNAGDPAEFEGLHEVFGENNPRKQVIALGSVKSQIGHTKATAGAASLIKASLALHHKVLPATINVAKPNPAMDIENTPFYLNTETRPWFKHPDGFPRRAGVSSFGFGGTNFHIAIEEYQNERQELFRTQASPMIVLLSADSPENLKKICLETRQELEGADAANFLNQLDTGSYAKLIPASHARVGFLADSNEDALEKLAECLKLMDSNSGQTSWSHPKGIDYRSSGMDPAGKTVALFPGQGSQYVNMGKELAINFPLFRESFEKADDQFAANKREALTNAVYPIPVFSDAERNTQQDHLTATENAQPAIGTFSLGLYKMLQSAGFKAEFFAGHSFGELTALWASGALDDDAFIRLAAARGQAMSTPASSGKDTGSMSAVKGDVEKIKEVLKDHPEVQIANFNSPSQVVLAGSTAGIQAVKPVLEKAGLSVYPLKVSAAFHTAFVSHAKEPFSAAIKKESFKKPQGQVFSNSSALPYSADTVSISGTLSDHILNPVRFKDEIENIYAAGGSIFIEIGPKNILSNLVKDILAGQPHEVITLNPNPKGDSGLQFRQAVLQMRILGFELGNIDPYRRVRRQEAPASSKVAVTLNGGLYVTEATRQKFSQAIEKKTIGQQSVSSALNVIQPVDEVDQNTEKPAAIDGQDSLYKTKTRSNPSGTEVRTMASKDHNFEVLIERLQAHQSEVLKAHEQFLKNDSASRSALQEITGVEISLLSGKNGSGQIPADERVIARMEKQAELLSSQHVATSDAHQDFIRSQTAFTQQYAALIQGLMSSGAVLQLVDSKPAAQIISEIPAEERKVVSAQMGKTDEVSSPSFKVEPAPMPAGYSTEELNLSFLAIVSEKTGYPVDMLELSMDMEADLGIDSIKRVEILGAMQEKYAELPVIEAEELVSLRTLEQVTGAFKVESGSAQKTETKNIITASEKTSAPADAPISLNNTEAEIQRAFLDIVSEKTGYPVDMLELNMDMEADLGIDSIKRVEILGAVQEKFPGLPSISAEDLVELRSLEQIIGAFKSGPVNAPTSEPVKTINANAQTISPEEKPENKLIQSAEVQASFLDIVSEKTGYPTDMLELGMDMEADLGIDSIKRVEILGAVQEKHPDLPSISAEELVELRTLEQIIAKFTSSSAENEMESGPVKNTMEANTGVPAAKRAASYPVSIRPLPKPDQMEFYYPNQSTVLITDDASDRAKVLAELMRKDGVNIGIIHFRKNGSIKFSNSSKGVKHYLLESTDENLVATLMEKVIAENKKIVAFIHLEPARIGAGKNAIDISDESAQSLKSVFLMARYLKAPLTEAAAETRSAFLTVTQMDGQFGLNGYQSADPLPGGFSGLAKTLRLEWTHVFCRALDFHPDLDAETTAEKINEELHDADLRLTEVGYTPDGRFTVALEGER